MDKQLNWLDSVLASAKEDWVLVVGHHPILQIQTRVIRNVWIWKKSGQHIEKT